MSDPIIESGGWKSKKEADEQAAGGALSFAAFVALGAALSVYLSVVGSLWWVAAAAILGLLAVRTWCRVRKLDQQVPQETTITGETKKSESVSRPPESH